MPTFVVILTHSPENCPLTNEQRKKVTLETQDKIPALQKKYRIKLIGAWHVPPEHLQIRVLEAPSSDTLLKYMMDPEIMKSAGYSTREIKVAMPHEEYLKLLK